MKASDKIKDIFQRYKHGIPLLAYMVFYLSWFAWLERANTKNFQEIHMPIDDYIPFCEVFVIPYFLWFAYVSVVVLFLFFRNKQDYYKACAFLFTGMTIFLVVSTLWPNGHYLRPAVMPRDNIFTDMVAALWRTDTPTNLWPSIHVFNSMGAHFAVMHNKELADKRYIRIGSFLLAVSIILSTVFIKQHSMFDVITGLVMGGVLYVCVYRRELVFVGRTQRGKGTPQIG